MASLETSASGATLQCTRVVLTSGLTLLHSEARANQSVVTRLMIRAGASREDPSEQGLAGLTGRMLRQGTTALDKLALAEELDGLGAGLSVDVGYALVSGSIKCLSDDFTRAVEILGEVMQHPTFPEAELERVRGQVLTDLKEAEDNTRVRADRAWRELAYPESHRYSRPVSGTAETISALTRDDLIRFHQRWYGPNQATAIVVGDVSLDEVAHALEAVFGDWQAVQSAPVETTLPPASAAQGQTSEVPMAGKTQADLVLGLPTFGRREPDYYALAFANHVLGRMYFMGRFGEKVRDEQGLAYYASSDLSAGYGKGPWTVRAGVNPRNLERAIESIRAELERFRLDGPTEVEHADGIQSLIGGLPRQLETNEGVAAVLSEIELYGLGLDYLDRYPGIIGSLTREQVTEAARKWLLPEHMVTAIAGPPRETSGAV